MLPNIKPPAIPKISINPVKSSSIMGHGYDAATRTLAVQFKGGKTYHYEGVPPEVMTSLGKAESAGSFISKNLVGKFKTTKLEPGQ